MVRITECLLGAVTTVAFLTVAAQTRAAECPRDSVEAGSWCVDKHEASTWETTNKRIIRSIKEGRIESSDQLVRGALRRGDDVDDYDDANCPDTANGCTQIFAVSIPDVIPSSNITWFQAAAACRNSGKELLPNGVWQSAAFGTPDPGEGDGVTTCNTFSGGPVPTGSTGDCVSDVGAHDMVGNVWEWVENWMQNNQDVDIISFIPPSFGGDTVAEVDEAFDRRIGFPSALLRGGDFSQANSSGVFALLATDGPASASRFFGFRCGRPK
jgi:hypothetical protein